MFIARPSGQAEAALSPAPSTRREARPQQQPADVQRLARLSAVAVALAILALGVGSYMTVSANARLQSVEGQQASIVVTTAEIPAGAAIDASNVTTKEVASDALPSGAVTDIDEVVGKTATGYLASGAIVASGTFTGKSAQSAAGRIDAGMVAVSVTVNQQTGVAGLIRQGDKVSILSAQQGQGEATSQVLAQHAEVIALDADLDGYSSDYSAVTVKLAPADAQKVTAACAEGKVAIALEASAG